MLAGILVFVVGAFSICSSEARIGHTEVLLGGTTLLNNLDKTGLELLNGGNVVGEDTHLTGGGGDVDLGPVVGRFVSIQGTDNTSAG
jgi:hypothetical protein